MAGILLGFAESPQKPSSLPWRGDLFKILQANFAEFFFHALR
jgi:hypothetical protein